MTAQAACPIPSPLRAVVWDFNGTLIDDVELAVRSVNAMLDRRGLPSLDVSAYRRVFGFPLRTYYRSLGIDARPETMARLAEEFHAGYIPGLSACAPMDGVLDVLRLLRAAGVAQVVLSAMEESSLRSAIAALGIDAFFDQVAGLEHRRADSKIEQGRKLMRSLPFAASEMLVIGDTAHDIEVGSALGIRAILVAQGHQGEQRLRGAGFPVVSDFRALRLALQPLVGP